MKIVLGPREVTPFGTRWTELEKNFQHDVCLPQCACVGSARVSVFPCCQCESKRVRLASLYKPRRAALSSHTHPQTHTPTPRGPSKEEEISESHWPPFIFFLFIYFLLFIMGLFFSSIFSRLTGKKQMRILMGECIHCSVKWYIQGYSRTLDLY